MIKEPQLFITYSLSLNLSLSITHTHTHTHTTPLSSIAFGRSSTLHPVSTQNWCMYVFADRPTLKKSLMSPSIFLQRRPACLLRLTRVVFSDGRNLFTSITQCNTKRLKDLILNKKWIKCSEKHLLKNENLNEAFIYSTWIITILSIVVKIQNT